MRQQSCCQDHRGGCAENLAIVSFLLLKNKNLDNTTWVELKCLNVGFDDRVNNLISTPNNVVDADIS